MSDFDNADPTRFAVEIILAAELAVIFEAAAPVAVAALAIFAAAADESLATYGPKDAPNAAPATRPHW
ncbi:MAG: hypothetical protein K0R92_2702 [Lachnospiraceae bacterium]|nr:hypothetical protein [Lachnospiraceae bacterium]